MLNYALAHEKRVEQWDSRSFSGVTTAFLISLTTGFGAVSGAGTWLFMLNGRIVGVFDGDIDDFENASGTIYQAPPLAPVALLYGRTRRRNTCELLHERNTLEDVDATLQDGSFTGYIELSENVLSGDYYAVYYGGRRMAAAYIGNAERLITGDEAFERANDEIGIYEVINVDLEVTDVPETNHDGSASSASSASETSSPTEDSSSLESLSVGSIDISDSDPSDRESSSSDSDTGSGIEGITADDGSLAIETDSEEESAGITDDSPTESVTLEDDTISGSVAAEGSQDTDSVRPEGESSPDPSPDLDVDHSEQADPESGPTEPTDPTATGERARSSKASETADVSSSEDESALDPDEVEAAAEELDRNDIS